MFKLPVAGFAKRVDDTVARAMKILRSREDYTAKRPATTQAFQSPKPIPVQVEQ